MEKERLQAEVQTVSTDRDLKACAAKDLEDKLANSQNALESSTVKLAQLETNLATKQEELEFAQKDLGDQVWPSPLFAQLIFFLLGKK